MKKSTMQKAAVVGAVATAVTAGAVLLSSEKNRKKVANTVGKAIKKVNTPAMKKRLAQAAEVVMSTQKVVDKSAKSKSSDRATASR